MEFNIYVYTLTAFPATKHLSQQSCLVYSKDGSAK